MAVGKECLKWWRLVLDACVVIWHYSQQCLKGVNLMQEFTLTPAIKWLEDIADAIDSLNLLSKEYYNVKTGD